ncbi:putative membrane protein [Nocardioides albertanoniae]|uniref:Putative membrane protein n=1 Tax=Nocardioides albertanoniae TaxID=1175486 RepID=A0A543A467_9ACTN|nr:YhgE/Pip domain-containing protein [Nocardioides albertanoniae]TQL67380.1 putative membrane protein [Nocardioides albertanoniae]
MNSLRIALTELRRITAGRLAKLVIVALVLVPTLYAGLYLYANHDPYAHFDELPAALVVEDTAATTTDGTKIDAGRQVADKLLKSGDFDWSETSTAEAQRDIREGDYYFALRIPEGFSRSLSGAERLDPERAQIQVITNDANSYLSTTIATNVTDKVRDAIASEVSEQAAANFLLGISDLRSGLVKAADGSAKLEKGAGTLRDGSGELATGAGELGDGLSTIEGKVTDLPDKTRQLADGARQVSDGNDQIAATGQRARSAVDEAVASYDATRKDLDARMKAQGLDDQERADVLAVYDRGGAPLDRVDQRVGDVSDRLDELASGADQVADGNEQLADAMPDLVAGISKAADGAGELSAGATKLRAGAGRLTDGAGDLTKGLRDGVAQAPATNEELRKQIASTISDPVAIDSVSEAKASSYGAGLAPFFLALGAWIGGYVLFLLVRPISSRALAANQTPLRVALGGWITPALIGVAQMLVVLVVVGLAVDITPANWLGTLGFLLLISATFIAIVHMLNALLGAPGQFLGLVLMVIQLVTAGGTFPWQTIPEPLHWLHHVLPMSYAVDGLRQLMYGGLSGRVVTDVLVLLAFLVGALLVTGHGARRQRVWTPKRVRPEIVL